MLYEIVYVLRRWIVGQSLLALCVGLLTCIGLALLGAPFAVALGLLAGFMEFIPYIGPFVAAVPAILVGFGEGPQLALWIALLFLAIQSIESYVLAPLIQHARGAPAAGSDLVLAGADGRDRRRRWALRWPRPLPPR